MLKSLLLSPRTVIGEVEALLDDGVDIDGPMLPGSLTRMQQHVLDDRLARLPCCTTLSRLLCNISAISLI